MTQVLKTSALLKKALAVIAKPENWCQGHNAVDSWDGPVDITESTAVAFCSFGAISKASRGSDGYGKMTEYLQAAVKETTGNTYVSDYNDNHTHEEVKALFRKAIALAEKDGD